jgi:2-methylcitrate dehydratase PrpD
MAIGTEHYQQQWHQTATMGIFGAVAAAGWMLGLDLEQWRNAVGFAASNACGVHANFGTMTKPSHAGQAAEAGLLAAGLAKRGFTGNPGAFEAFSTQSAGIIDWEPVHEIGDTWTIEDTLFKQYASGAGTQSTINATKRLGLSADEVIHGEVRTPPAVLTSGYGVKWPKVGLEAKFSLPGCMALTILGYDLSDPYAFSDENVQSEQFVDLIQRIELVGDPTHTEWMATLVVETPDGIKTESANSNRDSGPVESRSEFLRQKFDTLSTPVAGANAKQVGDLLTDIESVPQIAQICALLAVSPS